MKEYHIIEGTTQHGEYKTVLISTESLEYENRDLSGYFELGIVNIKDGGIVEITGNVDLLAECYSSE